MINKKGKKIDLSLSATLTLFIASAPFIFIFLYLGRPWVSGFLALIDLVFLFFFFLGKKGKLWAPTIGTLLLANFAAYFFNIVLGSSTHIYILFFPFVVLPLIVIESSKKITSMALASIPILGYFVTHFIEFNPFFSDPLSKESTRIVHIGVVIATFAILILVEEFLFKENAASKKALMDSNTALQDANLKLVDHATQLEAEKSQKEDLLKEQIQTSAKLESEAAIRIELYKELEKKILESEKSKKQAKDSAAKEHELRLKFEEQAEELSKKLKLEQDLVRAGKMQERILPKGLPDEAQIFLDSLFKPARHLSGDYWMWRYTGVKQQKIMVIIADVMGKAADAGVSSLAFAQKMNDYFEANYGRDLEVNGVFNFIQKVVITDIMFDRKSLSIAVVLIDLDNRSFEWGNAGLEHLQYITRKDGQIMTMYLEADNGPFGMENNAILVQKRPYEPGAILVGYSDGVVDIRNKKDDRLNEEGFEAIKNDALLHHDASYILPAILEKLWDFRGDAEQADDITMVLVEFK